MKVFSSDRLHKPNFAEIPPFTYNPIVGKEIQTMAGSIQQVLLVVVFFGIWLIVTRFVLPRLGVST